MICMQVWAPPLLNQFMPKRMLKIRGSFMHVALCEIVVNVWYGFTNDPELKDPTCI
jgi:hypothetical protein